MKTKLLLIAGALGLLVATFFAGRYSKPAEVKTEYVKGETKVEWKTRVVYKYIKKNQDKETTTTTKPDGTIIVVEKEHTETETTSNNNTTGSSTTTKTETGATVLTSARPNWHVGAKVGLKADALRLDPLIYGVSVERRFIGTLWLGAWGMTNKTAGVGAFLEF